MFFEDLEEEWMDLVDVKVHAPTATIVLDRPNADNRLDERLIEQLCQALDDLHQEKKVRAVVLTGAGNHFCCGLDLQELHSHTLLDELEAMPLWILSWQRLADLIEKMLRFPKPIIAAVDGQATGAGFSLSLAADLVVASDQATFSAPTVRMGILPGVLAPLATHRLGSAIASRLLFTAQTLTAAEAQRIGWVTQLVTSDQIWVAANEVAHRSAAVPHQTVLALKRLLNETIAEQLFTQLSLGAASAATVASTEAGIEGLKAAMKNREPKWSS